MDSRSLIGGEQNPNVLIDSESVDNALRDSNDSARRILHYQHHDAFSYLRSPFDTPHELLSTVEEYEFKRVSDQPVDLLAYADTQSAFRYTKEMIEAKQNRLENDGYSLSEDELQVVAVCRSFNDLPLEDSNGILITDNDTILKNRLAVESEFSGESKTQLNIISLDEAKELLGLFMRYHDDFRIYPDEMNGGSIKYEFTTWCWSLSNILVPHLEGIDGLVNRLHQLIIGIDELGFQYYSGSDNSSNMKTEYHFGHVISLITGIFDSLVIHTRDMYDLDIEKKQTSIRTGEKLFGQLRDIDKDIWDFTHNNHHFVELIYVLRPLVIHRDGVMGGTQGGIEDNSTWTSHYVGLNDLADEDRDEFEKYYQHLDDELLDYDPLTRWGLICYDDTMDRLPEEHQLIEPYQFVKTALRTLLEFIDNYLDILGYENSLNRQVEETDTAPTAQHIYHRNYIQRYMMSPLM